MDDNQVAQEFDGVERRLTIIEVRSVTAVCLKEQFILVIVMKHENSRIWAEQPTCPSPIEYRTLEWALPSIV